MINACFIGAGRLGATLAAMAQKTNATVTQWDAVPGLVKNQQPLHAIVPQADVLFLCINSWHIRNAAKKIHPHLKPRTLIVSASKGIEARTRFTIDALLADVFPGQPIALLSGPMLAHELAREKFGAAVVATKRKNDFQKIATLFANAPLQLTHVTDLRATAIAGVLKNAYALLLGIADALNLGQNAQGYIAMRAVQEMTGVLRLLSPASNMRQIILGPAGLGDLLATGFSPKSTNVQLGHDLAAGRKPTRTSEGFVSLPPLMKLLGKHAKQFPLLATVHAIAIQKKNAKKILPSILH